MDNVSINFQHLDDDKRGAAISAAMAMRDALLAQAWPLARVCGDALDAALWDDAVGGTPDDGAIDQFVSVMWALRHLAPRTTDQPEDDKQARDTYAELVNDAANEGVAVNEDLAEYATADIMSCLGVSIAGQVGLADE